MFGVQFTRRIIIASYTLSGTAGGGGGYSLNLFRHFKSYPAICDLLFGECRARSAYTYVQSDLDLHSPLLLYKFLSMQPNTMAYYQFETRFCFAFVYFIYRRYRLPI